MMGVFLFSITRLDFNNGSTFANRPHFD